MQRRRENPLPLIVGLVLAVAVHLLAAPPASYWLHTPRVLEGPADLRVENIVVPDDVLRLNRPNAVSFDVVNRGRAPVDRGVAWEDRVYLSADDALDPSDELLLTAPSRGALEPGRRYRSEGHALTLPPGTQPPFYLLFVTDADNAVDERWHEDNNVRARRFDPVPDEPRQVAVGHPDAPRRVTVAWISHEDFRKLNAPPSETEQPALQSAVDPAPAAPMQPDPTPPAPPQAAPTEQPATPAEAGGTLAQTPAQQSPTAPPAPADEQPDVAVAPESGENRPARPDLQNEPGEGDSTADAQPAASDEPARPSSVPRDEGESDPFVRYPHRIDVHPGGTLTGKGIEITTARPDFGAVARVSTLPANPDAELTFDGAGTVVNATITKTSGSENIDAPLLRSFYRWNASGELIDTLGDRRLILKIHVILRDPKD